MQEMAEAQTIQVQTIEVQTIQVQTIQVQTIQVQKIHARAYWSVRQFRRISDQTGVCDWHISASCVNVNR
jgi:hypothetical protein